MTPERLAPLRLASQVEPAIPAVDVQSTEGVEFRGPDGTTLTTAHPLTKAALLHLAQAWPHAVPFERLLTAAQAMLNAQRDPEGRTDPTAKDAQVLGTNLLTVYGQEKKLDRVAYL